MTDNTQELDKILGKLQEATIVTYVKETLDGVNYRSHHANRAKAKQAITSLIKELVAEAKPGTWVDPEDTDDLEWQGYVNGVNDFEQNLLKALEADLGGKED